MVERIKTELLEVDEKLFQKRRDLNENSKT